MNYDSRITENDIYLCRKGKYLIHEFGGKPWVREDKKRVYIDSQTVANRCGVSYYEVFLTHDSIVTVDGEPVEDTARADAILRGFEGMKFYYDYKGNKVYATGVNELPKDISKRVKALKNRIDEELKQYS